MAEELAVFRTEKKYGITKAKKAILIDKLKQILQLDGNGTEEGYRVRSLYFDSIFDGDYIDKLDGLENRKKIRLRLYDPKQEKIKLEIKQKQGAAQYKRSVWISRNTAEQMIKGNYACLLELHNALATEIYCILETGVYRPKCIVEYHRTAFMENTNNTRITFDSDISASLDCSAFFEENISYVPVYDDLMEVKYNGFLLGSIKPLINVADESEVSISKYALSRGLLG